MSQKIISVSTLVHYLKSKLESDSLIQKVLVEGEISNFSSYRSGHWYFSLKDENSLIRCVMFSSYNKKVKFLPKDGDKVIIQADVSVYEQRGDIQLLVYAMKADTIGELYLEYERLKKKLFDEGLFDESHKKKIPEYPMHIALVTGANTAARSDVLTTLNRRWPIADIHEFNALVQGKDSAEQVIQALLKADVSQCDVILLVRGGGSIEDLWSFNDEKLAHVIYDLNTPIITGIGHEINFTISDYVADLRAPTPTGAAERCAPNQNDVLKHLNIMHERIVGAINRKEQALKDELDTYKNSYVFTSPQRLYSEKEIYLEHLNTELIQSLKLIQNELNHTLSHHSIRMNQLIQNNILSLKNTLTYDEEHLKSAIDFILKNKKNEFVQQANLLDAYSPLKSLTRGYSILEKEGNSVKSANNIYVGDSLTIILQDGKVMATATNIIKENENG